MQEARLEYLFPRFLTLRLRIGSSCLSVTRSQNLQDDISLPAVAIDLTVFQEMSPPV